MLIQQKRGWITTIAVLALGMPFAAQAGAEIYGKARVSLDVISNDTPSPGTTCSTATPPVATDCEDSVRSLSSNTSRLGFKGEEDLGEGLSVLWQIETQVDIDTGTAFQNARNTFVGLSGGFGTVLAGRYETPLRMVTGRFDPFADTKGDYNAIIGNILGTRLFDNRVPNIVSYAAPDLSGLKLQAAYSVNRVSDDLPMSNDDSERDLAGVGAGYESGSLYIAAGYETIGSLTSGNDGSAFRLGASWSYGQGTTVAALYENADRGGDNGERSAWYLSVVHKMDDNSLKAALAMADEVDGISDSGATQLTLGAFHALSSSTEIYALYTMVDNDKNGTYGLWSGTQAVAGFADKSVSAFSLGINHNFSSR